MKASKLLALLLALLLLAALFTACKENPLKAAAGTYLGESEKLVGDGSGGPIDYKLVLSDDGTGTHYRDDLEIKVTWTLEGEAFTMKETFLGVSLDYTGTLKDGTLDIFNGDPNDMWTYEYFYKKQ